MLKKFLLNSLSAFVGAWIALALFGIAAVIFVLALVGRLAGGDTPSVERHSILKISLTGEINEVESTRQIDYMQIVRGQIERPQALNVLVKAIQEARDNRNIDAILLDCNGVSAAPATLDALRRQLLDFKKGGKPVYAYGDGMSMGDYFVATAADSLFLNPDGMLELHGISGTSLYFGSLMQKIGVEFQVCRVGTFKSAVEPYISDQMSAPARAQLDTLYGNMWRYIRNDIASARKLKPELLDSMVSKDFLMLHDGSWLCKKGLVDRAVYRRELDDIMARAIGRDPGKLNYVSPQLLTAQTDWGAAYNSRSQIAVLYAVGDIAETSDAGINCARLVPVIKDLADNDKVKAMVLRVNSPGGSVFGSEQIAEALAYFQKKGKKLVVSMGDYAASGGYWISCHADRIYADPLTITGSIGIFGLFPNASVLLDKIGVSPQSVSTNPNAVMRAPFAPLTESQMTAMQTYIDKGYERFITRVATGRHMNPAKVRQIAEGRVWDAETAKRIGLVDKLGTLHDAIACAAELSKMNDDYDVAVYPEAEPSWIDMIPMGEESEGIVKNMLQTLRSSTPNDATARHIFSILWRKPMQARALEVDVRL